MSGHPPAPDTDFEPLDEELQPIEAVAQSVQRTSNRRQKLPRVGVLESVILGISGLHGPLARQEPLPADRQGRAERHDKVDARGLALQVPPDGLGVGAGDLTDTAIGSVTDRGQESLVQG